jgi:hypothetical protein
VGRFDVRFRCKDNSNNIIVDARTKIWTHCKRASYSRHERTVGNKIDTADSVSWMGMSFRSIRFQSSVGVALLPLPSRSWLLSMPSLAKGSYTEFKQGRVCYI